MEKENKDLIEFQKRMQSEGKLEESAYFSKDIRGASFDAANVGWDDATLAKYDTIIGYNDEDTKTNAEAARNNFVTDLKDTLGTALGMTITDQYASAFEQFTLSDVSSLVASISNAGAFGGENAITNLGPIYLTKS